MKTDFLNLNNISFGFRIKKNTLSIAYTGILQEGRMLRELVEIVSENTDMELHIAGFGEMEDYLKIKSTHFNNIHFYGILSYAKALEMQKSCDILAALYDPQKLNHVYAAPNKLYEALLLGKPIIMVENTGLDSVVSTNQFGKVIDFNLSALRSALNQLITETQTFPEISRKMHEYFIKTFSWKETERRMLSLYNIGAGKDSTIP